MGYEPLGSLPSHIRNSPSACHRPHRLQEVSAVSKWIIPSSALCCPGHKLLAATGEGGGKRICLHPRVDLCKSCHWDSGSSLQLCLLLLQKTSLQPRKAKLVKTSHSHPSIALPTPRTRTTTLSRSTGPSRAPPKVTVLHGAGGKGSPFLPPNPAIPCEGTPPKLGLDPRVGLGQVTCQSDPRILAALGTQVSPGSWGLSPPYLLPPSSPSDPSTCLLAAPRARRFSSGGEEDGYDRGMHKVSDLPARSLAGESWQQAVLVVVGFGEEAQPSSATQEGATTIPAALCHLSPLGRPQHGV